MEPVPQTGLDAETRPDSTDPDGPCVVCLDPLADPCRLEPCGHVNFHFACINRWLLEKPRLTCPLCKTPVRRAVLGPAGGHQVHEYGPLDPSLLPLSDRPSVSPANAQESPEPPPRNAHPHLERSRRRRRRHRDCPAWSSRNEAEPDGLAFRRLVYRHLLYSMHVGSNPVSRYRELTLDSFRYDAEVRRRTSVFLRRELRVFRWLTTPDGHDIPPRPEENPRSLQDRRRAATLEQLHTHLVRLLQYFELRGSDGGLEDIVTTYLGRQNTRLLLHELNSFLRSPYATLHEWDRVVQYPNLPEPQSRDLSHTRGPGRGAHGQPSAPNRHGDGPRLRDNLVHSDPARHDFGGYNAPVTEYPAPSRGSSNGARSRSSGRRVRGNDTVHRRQDEGEEVLWAAGFVFTLRNPAKR